MKRKTIALLLTLIMCLALLSACGGNSTTGTKEPQASGDTSSPIGQEPADVKEEQPTQEPEQEEPKQDEPEESEEPTQEEHEGTKFLALLQEEYKSGFFEGEGPKRTYYEDRAAFIYDGVVHIRDVEGHGRYWEFCSYDIATKKFKGPVSPEITGFASNIQCHFLSGNSYYVNYGFEGNSTCETRMYDCNNVSLHSLPKQFFEKFVPFEQGILGFDKSGAAVLLSYDLEKIADIPVPQHEVAHGLKEDVEFRLYIYVVAADGTVYAMGQDDHWYRLDMDTYEWEDAGEVLIKGNGFQPFLGKYIAEGSKNEICNRVTGEVVFNWNEAGVYPPASTNQYHGCFCYFGDNRYLGYSDRNKEYRWVNLTDLSMSEPLPFPEVSSDITILNDTYCVYRDRYGWFLWNYNTGEEETIVLFEQ